MSGFSSTKNRSLLCNIMGTRPAPLFKSLIRSICGKLFSALVAGDYAVSDMDDAIGVFGDIGFMGDQHNRVAFFMQVFHKPHDFAAGLRIQVAGGLVGQDNRRIINKGAGNGDALALSTGKFIGLVVHAFAQVHCGERGGALNAFVEGVPL